MRFFFASIPAEDLTEASPESPELPPISIEPDTGVIEANKIKIFNVCFSPVRVAQYQGRLVCRYQLCVHSQTGDFPLFSGIFHLFGLRLITQDIRFLEKQRYIVT